MVRDKPIEMTHERDHTWCTIVIVFEETQHVSDRLLQSTQYNLKIALHVAV